MRVFFCIRIGMMYAVHDGIYSRTYIRRSLAYVGKQVKETFPKFAHAEGSMRCVTEKSLHEDRQVPVTQKTKELLTLKELGVIKTTMLACKVRLLKGIQIFIFLFAFQMATLLVLYLTFTYYCYTISCMKSYLQYHFIDLSGNYYKCNC